MDITNRNNGFDTGAALILAAGAGTRMGCVKQLLPYGEGTMLSHVIGQARQAGFERIVVVLGANAEVILPAFDSTTVEVVINSDWRTGMGSSIVAGLTRLTESGVFPETIGILLADQPQVDAAHLRAMRERLAASGALVVAAEYEKQYGVPAFFRQEMFPHLAALPPESGARQLLRAPGLSITGFALPEAAADIDTPADFAALRMVAR